MIQEREELGSRLFGILITVLSLLAFFAAYILMYWNSGLELAYDSHYLTLVLLIIPISYYGIKKTNLTRFYGLKGFLDIFLESGLFVISTTGILAASAIIFKLSSVDLTIFLIFAAIFYLALAIMISLSHMYHRSLMKKGMNVRNIIVIADHNSINFIEALFAHEEWGYRVMAIVSDSELIYEV